MTWANQVRVLRQQFQALGAVIGQGLIQALKPALIAFNQFLSRVIEFAKKVLNALGKIFGWTVDISGGGLDTDLSEAEDAATGLGDALGGAGDSAGDAADSVKELKKQLQGFDKLNVLTTTETGGGSGGSGGGGGGSGSGGGGGGAGSTNDIAVNLQKTEGLFESEINNLYSLGAMISKTLQETLDNIDWDSIYEKARGFGTGLARFLNGLFGGDAEHNVFASLGRTVAGAINTALNFFDSFADEFNFSTFGTNLASFFVETVENIDWTMAGSAFHKWMQGIKDAFKAFVEYLWDNKDEVFKAIKDFLSEITIEDIAIFIGLITISKIGKWILAEGVLSLAGQAIGALFKGVGISILANLYGVSFGEMASTVAGSSLISEFAQAAGLGTTITASGALAVALPIAALVIFSVIAWKVGEKDYEEYQDANAAVKRLVTAGVDGETLKTTVAWQVKHKLDTENQGAFVNDTFGSMFTDYHLDENGNLEYDMNGFVHVDWDVKLNWIKDKWQSLKDWIKEQWSDITGGLGGSEWSQTWSATVADVKAQGKVALDWIKDKWKTFKEWLKENLFSSSDNATYNNDGTITTAAVINSNFHVKLGEMIKSGWTTFTTWLKEKIFGKNDNGTTDLGERNVSISPLLKSGVAGAIPFAAELTTWFRTKEWANGSWNGSWRTITGFTAELTNWFRAKKWSGGSWHGYWRTISGFTAELTNWYRAKKWANGSWNGTWRTIGGFTAKLTNWFRSSQWVNGGDAWNSIAFKARLTSYELGSALRNAVINIGAKITGKETGGIFTNTGWKPIQAYASGGLPTYGQMFLARESGPELVGTIGGHTAVMNNSQIVSSVANGVASAVSGQNAILLQQNELLRQLLAKEVGITSGDIFDAVRSENRNYTNRTGKSAFSY